MVSINSRTGVNFVMDFMTMAYIHNYNKCLINYGLLKLDVMQSRMTLVHFGTQKDKSIKFEYILKFLDINNNKSLAD